MSRGHNRERSVKRWLEEDGYVVVRAAGSLGGIDLVALKAGRTPLFVECKSTAAGPFHSFGPANRECLRLAAERAGAEAILAWWPSRRPLVWLKPSEWPERRAT